MREKHWVLSVSEPSGVKVANTARHLGMNVIGYDPYLSVDAAWRLSSHIKKAKNMEQIFETADYITVHVPLNDSTRNLLNKDTFAMMKDGVRILNFSRGELVNNSDIKNSWKAARLLATLLIFRLRKQ